MDIALVDDSRQDRADFRALLTDYSLRRGPDLSITEYESAEALLADYRPFRFAVIFLDIYMGGMSGTECAARLRETDMDVVLVFLTTSESHMAEAFSAHAYDYLQKPTDPQRVERLMDDLLRRQGTEPPALTFIEGRERRSLRHSEIAAVCIANHELEIIAADGTRHRTRMTFSAALEQLAGDRRFLQLMRGVLVNMDCITGFDQNVCRLAGGLRLPVRVRELRQLEQTWQNFLFAGLRRDAEERRARQ